MLGLEFGGWVSGTSAAVSPHPSPFSKTPPAVQLTVVDVVSCPLNLLVLLVPAASLAFLPTPNTSASPTPTVQYFAKPAPR